MRMVKLNNLLGVIGRKKKKLTFLLGISISLLNLGKLYIFSRRGIKLGFYKSNLSLAYWYNKDEREEDDKVIKRNVNEGNIVIDIGANIGFLSILMSKIVGTNGLVFSVEAHPTQFKILGSNLKINSTHNVVAKNYAVGNKNKNTFISNKLRDDCNSISKKGNSIKMIRLDDMIPESIKK